MVTRYLGFLSPFDIFPSIYIFGTFAFQIETLAFRTFMIPQHRERGSARVRRETGTYIFGLFCGTGKR